MSSLHWKTRRRRSPIQICCSGGRKDAAVWALHASWSGRALVELLFTFVVASADTQNRRASKKTSYQKGVLKTSTERFPEEEREGLQCWIESLRAERNKRRAYALANSRQLLKRFWYAAILCLNLLFLNLLSASAGPEELPSLRGGSGRRATELNWLGWRIEAHNLCAPRWPYFKLFAFKNIYWVQIAWNILIITIF